MKHTLLIITFLLIASTAFSQENDHNYQYEYLYLPRDTDGNIVYQEVVEVEGKTADELFTSARLWFTDTFKSSNDVIQYEDRYAGIITGKGFSQVPVATALVTLVYRLWYTIQIETKEGRFRYTIKNLSLESTGDPTTNYNTPIEEFFEESRMYRNNGKPRESLFKYYDAYITSINSLESRLKLALSGPPVRNNDDW